jgi:nitroimidazol reductase NimA-like FMN-containing flavoprotein (pyridoxamine 5'-phosphate oxidase superfamily)
VKQRDRVAMTGAEVDELLASQHKVQLATNGHDGFPHLVTMYYALVDGLITFWTYRTSQKALNLERDPRISCLVEVGEQYFDLKGVLIQGRVRRIDDPAAVVEIGRRISAVFSEPLAAGDATTGYVEHAARKRFGYAVEPTRVISWDHTKLLIADSGG